MANPINTLSVCSGVGMLDVGCHAGLEHVGIKSRTVAYAEWDAYAAAQLLTLMEAGCLDAAPVFCGDLGRIDGKSLRGRIDAVIGGFPCQPFSVAGKQEGVNDERAIWPAIARLVRDSGAWLVAFENVAGIFAAGGFDPVARDLAEIGFDAEWTVLSAGEVGASHRRERVFIVGVLASQVGRLRELRESSGRDGQSDCSGGEGMAHSNGSGGSIRQDGRCRDVTRSKQAGSASQRVDAGAYMADAQHGLIQEPGRGSQGRNGAGSAEPVLGHADCQERRRELESREPSEHRWPGLDGTGECLADAGEPRSQGGQQHRACDGDRGGAETHGSVEQLCGLFAPGPSDPSWPDILRESPWLAPATESGVCGLADGLALVVDESRRDQLRCIGNGVVPLQAAAAIVGLVRRLIA